MKRSMIILALSAACGLAGCASDGTFNTASNGNLNANDLGADRGSVSVRQTPNPNNRNNDATLNDSDYNNSTASGSDTMGAHALDTTASNQAVAPAMPATPANGMSTGAASNQPAAATPQPMSPAGNDKTAISSMVAQRDQDFLKDATAGGIYEVQAAQKALAKSSDGKVKDLAQHMLDDHSKVNKELAALAQQKGLHISNNATDPDHVALLGKLDGLNGADFDREYLRQQQVEHQNAIAKFETASNSGADRDIRDFAASTLPRLRDHLAMINTDLGLNNTNIGSEQH